VLLDEPLANLDYKLREELRVELPRLFAETGAIFVYATTEPHEALLLGGQTATLHQGQVTQFGKTLSVYNRPNDLSTALTFADPPLNLATVNIADNEIYFGDYSLGKIDRRNVEPAHLPEGTYTAALRSHHVSLSPSESHRISLPATVGSSEITGSETYIHVDTNGSSWVVLTHGVHRVASGQNITLHIDPENLYLFDRQQILAHAPLSVALKG